MGFWSDTFGGGNSFSESVANVFTPGDGASYVGGNLVNTNDNTPVASNSSGGYTTNTGKTVTGSANSESTGYTVKSGDTLSAIAARSGKTVKELMDLNPSIKDPNSIVAGAALNTGGASSFFKDGVSIFSKDKDAVKGKAPSGISKILGFASPVGIMGKLAGWANDLDPEVDTTKVVDGRQVYENADGFQYSYNFLGLPYEVNVEDGKVVDALSVKDPVTGLTGYEQKAQEARDRGDNDQADAIMQEAADNANPGTGSGGEGGGTTTGELSTENIAAMAVAAGIATSNEEIQKLLANPTEYLASKGMSLADLVKMNDVLIDPEAEGTSIDGEYGLGEDPTVDPELVGDTAVIENVDTSTTNTVIADTTADSIINNPNATVNAVTGTVSADATLDPDGNQIDMTGAATGVNADGTANVTGEALNDFASINTSMIIDTSTVAGKLLADKLAREGEMGVDSKATILGQMKLISEEFKDGSGNPIIPPWAQGMARQISRTMAFDGVTGTAATAAMSNAIMEATLGVAEKEATFFQTLTIKNMDNKQQSIINKMNILSKFEVANLDTRQAALVQNAKNFMEMDLRNLDNEQQAEVMNTQLMVDALFNDQAAVNAARIFNAEQGNDMAMFYDEILFQAQRYNTEMINSMRRFNAGEINDASEFNATMADGRERYNSTMQYNIDKYNSDWRQRVTEANAGMKYDAYAADVKNATDINQESLNRIWDRVDSMLDYYFKGAQTEAELDARVLMAEIQAAAGSSSSSSGMWGAIGSIGAALITSSDLRLKENIEFKGTINGIKTYTWDWNDEAKRIGADKCPTVGVIAQEIQKTHPDAVTEDEHGYLLVNYGKLS
jgi:murein DD-endopeptidase MepM/ murein hydrolase activator NlpD